MLRELVPLLMDTTHRMVGSLTELMELTVPGTALTETHLLDVGNQYLNLIIGHLRHLRQQALRFVILHLHYMNESEIVHGLGLTGMIAVGFMVGTPGIRLRRISIAIVISIRDGIQPVYCPSVSARTC